MCYFVPKCTWTGHTGGVYGVSVRGRRHSEATWKENRDDFHFAIPPPRPRQIIFTFWEVFWDHRRLLFCLIGTYGTSIATIARGDGAVATRIGAEGEREGGLLTRVDAWLQKIKIQWWNTLEKFARGQKMSHTTKNRNAVTNPKPSWTFCLTMFTVLKLLGKKTCTCLKKIKYCSFFIFSNNHNSFVCWWRDFYHRYFFCILKL